MNIRQTIQRRIAAIFFLVLAPLTTQELQNDELIIWNVGQGLWVTWVTAKKCLHFDMGGETADWRALSRACGRKQENRAYFSHWDWDHIGLAAPAARRLPHFCIAMEPAGPVTSSRKKAIFFALPHCAGTTSRSARKKPAPPAGHPRDSNAASRVYLVENRLLLPGDSPRGGERRWSLRLPQKAHVRWLVLGHHGSRTSTSQVLLNRLNPYLKLAIASARKRRYGHPHADVMCRLKANGVSALATEDWGHVHLALPLTPNEEKLTVVSD